MKGLIRIKEPLLIAAKDSDRETRDIYPYMVEIFGVMVPCIPGSTLKGIFRSEAEFLLASAAEKSKNSKFDVCNVLDYQKSCGGYFAKDLRKALRSNKDERIESILKKFCYSCQLFGSPNYRSRVSFFDAFPLDDYTKFSLGKSTGIAINRLSGEAKPGALFSTIYISPKSEFNFDLQAKNLPIQFIALLMKIIGRINDGYRKIGGFTTKGFGQVEIELTECNLDKKIKLDQDFQDLPDFLEFLPERETALDYTNSLVQEFSLVWNNFIKMEEKAF